MQEQLNKIIQENLPAMAAKELKTFISEAEKNQDKIDELERSLKYKADLYRDTSSELYDVAAELKNWETRSVKVAERELECEAREGKCLDREIRMDLTQAQYERVSADRSKDDILGLVETVFRNPVVKRTVHSNELVPTSNRNDSHWCDKTSQHVNDSVVSGHGEKEETTTEEVK